MTNIDDLHLRGALHARLRKAPPYLFHGLFVGAVIGSIAIHCVTLTVSPPIWQDECQIIDYGRTLFPGSDRSYAASWSARGRPLQCLNYVGTLLQETAYRVAGGSMVGPRLSAIIGASCAALAFYCWLRAACITPWIAVAAGCCFLWDPMFVQSYRGGRIDGSTMAFMLAALATVRRTSGCPTERWKLICAGLLVALSGLMWSSAVLLVPLLMHELWDSRYAAPRGSTLSASVGMTRHAYVQRLCIVGGTAVVFLALLLLPFWEDVRIMVTDLTEGVARDTVTTKQTVTQICASIPALFLRSPLLPLAALLGAVIYGPRSWCLPLCVALVAVMATNPYPHRVVYLVPYFAYGYALTADRAWKSIGRSRVMARTTVCVAVLLLLWSGMVSLVARTAVARAEGSRRDPALTEQFVDRITAGRSGRVLLKSWSLYYAFRSRGWAYWGPLDFRTPDDLAASLDYDLVVHDERAGNHTLDALLRERGYTRRVFSVEVSSDGPEGMTEGTPGYGPYVVYSHPKWDIGGE